MCTFAFSPTLELLLLLRAKQVSESETERVKMKEKSWSNSWIFIYFFFILCFWAHFLLVFSRSTDPSDSDTCMRRVDRRWPVWGDTFGLCVKLSGPMWNLHWGALCQGKAKYYSESQSLFWVNHYIEKLSGPMWNFPFSFFSFLLLLKSNY